MKNKRYTLHLVPETGEKPKTFTFKTRTFRIIVALIALLIVAITVGFYILIPKALDHDRIYAENKILIQDRLRVTRILSDYNQIRQMDHYIRSVLGPDLSLASLDSLEMDSLFIPAGVINHRGDQSIEISYLDNIPIYPPVEGYITQGFVNDHPFTDDNHYGVDIAAPEGDPILASASGVVIFSNWTNRFGYIVILYHSGGYFTIYAHNLRNIVDAHQYVSRGDVIAYVGDTGISEGPHLHFEIWRDGNPIDPQSIIYSYRHSDVSVRITAE